MKYFLKIYGCSFIILLASLNSFCQPNFIPGYIIDLQGDTLHGFIDYKATDVNPDRISFKPTIDVSQHEFHPENIEGFAVQNEIFKSAVVTVDQSSNRTEDVSYDTVFKPRADSVFLRTLIQGVKRLYYYYDMYGKEHFFIQKGTEFELLFYKKYKVMKDDAIGLAYNRKYLQQLAEYFEDCPEILAQLEDTEYKRNDLIKLFKFYYDCIDADIEFQREKDRHSLEFGIFGGPSLTKLNFISISFPYIAKVDYPFSPYFSGGLFLNIILPGYQKKYSFNNELFFTSYKVKGQYDEYVNENDYTTTYTTIGYSYLKMNNMFRFRYPVRNLFFYINAGISNGYAITEKNYKKKIEKAYTMYRVIEEEAIPTTQRYEQGYLLGIGTMYKKISFEIRYERGNGMSKHAYLRSNATRMYFLAGYKF